MGDLILPKVENSLVPSFMNEDKATGLELVNQYVVPPRLKVMQPMADYTMFEGLEKGDTVLMPQKLKLASPGEPWHFVPLFFYPEFITVNPIQMKGQLPMIRDRSLELDSAIANKSRSPETRKEKCPENPQLELSHHEVLTFIVALVGPHAHFTLPLSMSFWKGEHRTGTNFSGLIKMRGGPLFGGIYEAKVPKEMRKNAKGQWYGIDVGNPSDSSGMPPFVQDEGEFKQLKSMHLALKQSYDDRKIQVEYEDEEPSVDESKY